jgi:hypothetical protein
VPYSINAPRCRNGDAVKKASSLAGMGRTNLLIDRADQAAPHAAERGRVP